LVGLSSFASFLNAISSIAVILGAIFIVFQLRQNAKLIEATIRETRANASIALLEKITDESFARRRKAMRDAIKKYAALNWAGFDDTLEDYEARNFAYELIRTDWPTRKRRSDRFGYGPQCPAILSCIRLGRLRPTLETRDGEIQSEGERLGQFPMARRRIQNAPETKRVSSTSRISSNDSQAN
jgi:hypothetical protein